MTGLHPQNVIHFDFPVGQYIFDARPIWNAIRKAGVSDAINTVITAEFGPTAIAIVDKSILMGVALRKLDAALKELYALPELLQTVPVVRGDGPQRKKYDVLLYTDSMLFEFRSYLDLIANFAYGVLKGIGKAPSSPQTLANGKALDLLGKNRALLRNNYVLYLCDQLKQPTDWYKFLNSGRNHFTHEGAPDCVIEPIAGPPSSFEAVITKTNIVDFTKASTNDYFRISELQQIVNGVLKLAPAVQNYIEQEIFPS